MLLEACGLAVLAAVNPAALLIGAVYLGSTNPRKMVLYYLVGAIIMSAVMGIALIAIIQAGGLHHLTNHTPRYGLRLGLGVVALFLAGFLARRKPPAPGGTKAKQGRIARMTARPSPLTAVAVGVLVFYPSLNFIGAIQAIATSNAGLTQETIALVLVVLIVALGVWLPLLLHLIAPEATARRLRAFDGWLRAHRRTVLLAALLIGGLILIMDGCLGLAGVV